jgi:hypothetical protein
VVGAPTISGSAWAHVAARPADRLVGVPATGPTPGVDLLGSVARPTGPPASVGAPAPSGIATAASGPG